jgi:predicted transcriptional regulator
MKNERFVQHNENGMLEESIMLPWKKSRSKLGEWMDRRGLTQEWLAKETGISSNSISDLCSGVAKSPRSSSRAKIINSLRKIDPDVSAFDFW